MSIILLYLTTLLAGITAAPIDSLDPNSGFVFPGTNGEDVTYNCGGPEYPVIDRLFAMLVAEKICTSWSSDPSQKVLKNGEMRSHSHHDARRGTIDLMIRCGECPSNTDPLLGVKCTNCTSYTIDRISCMARFASIPAHC